MQDDSNYDGGESSNCQQQDIGIVDQSELDDFLLKDQN